MTELAVITANFGGIDDIKPFPAAAGIDSFCYTDQPTLDRTDPAVLRSWTSASAPDYPRHDFSPRLRGRYFKHQIHRLPEAERYRWLVWADATVVFKDPAVLLQHAQRLRGLPAANRMLVIPHPERATVREEYEFISDSIRRGEEYLTLRYAREKMTEQMAYFRSKGWSVEAPLWAGTVWMIENSVTMHRLLDDWWDQNLRFRLMDQLSLPVLAQQHRIDPQRLGVHLWNNDIFEWAPHRVLI